MFHSQQTGSLVIKQQTDLNAQKSQTNAKLNHNTRDVNPPGNENDDFRLVTAKIKAYTIHVYVYNVFVYV